MKLSSFKKKREAFEHEVRDDEGNTAAFSLLPLPADLMQMAQIYLHAGGKELLSPAQRIRFITDCIVGWSGVNDDDGEEIKFSEESKMQLAVSEYDGLLFELISAAFLHKNKLVEALAEDSENAKK